ncbi:MAG: Na/Pi cotransporter family protein [Candidatus Limivicinus sp.]|nr:Na/Pi cotransporter family protein [Candidatus Limivicinus sp.]
MDLFDVLNLIGGLCLFLFGMNVMGQALERRAGNRLRDLLGKLTTNKLAGLLTGLGVTAIIQSSSATTVMVVGFVNSGLMTLKQAINVIMGANIGTTVTAWILSLAGIDSGNLFVSLLKPSSFTPVLALIGIVFYMFSKNSRRQDTGLILLGFATLMFGMESMSDAVSGLREVPQFRQMMIAFQNPVLGVLAGAVLTAIIQSSSASVGILQALASTGQVSLGAAIPIIMGQNIGTCVTAMLSSVGTNKNARRAALVHLSFNVIGTAVWLVVFCLVRALVRPVLLDASASLFSIAVVHSAFNVLCTLLLLPMTGLLERLAHRLVPDGRTPDTVTEIDERLLATPPLALERCRAVAAEMAETSVAALKSSLACLLYYTPELAEEVREKEDKSDHYEDILSSYLVKLSSRKISESDSAEAAKLLKVIGDFERISDHAVNLVESAEEIKAKELEFTQAAKRELSVIISAVSEVLDLTQEAFEKDDAVLALRVEPLEQVIDDLKETLRTGHILRLQQGECSSVAGFVWSDILTNLERTSDHCSNVAGCIIDMSHHELHLHESQREFRNTSEDYRQNYLRYRNKYALS